MEMKHTMRKEGNHPTAEGVLGQGPSEAVLGAVRAGSMVAVLVAGTAESRVDLDSMVGDIAGAETGLEV